MLGEKRWLKLNNFSHSAGYAHAVFEINNTCYVVGTKGISTLNNEVYTFPSNQISNSYFATCRVGNNILVVCKDDDDVESSSFNLINKQWSDASINTKRKQFALVYYLNKVWIIGGSEHNDEKWLTLNTVEVYNPVTKNHILAPIKMNKSRSGHSVIVYNNKLFVFGGCGDKGPLNSVEMFSPGANNFVMMTPMKFARSHFACCRVGNLVYVVGGVGCKDETKSVEIYNLDSNGWTDGVDFPVAEWCLSACAVNNKLY